MNRVRAMILLFALLGGTGAAVAQAACSSSQACCTGGMCPIHRSRINLRGKSHCDGMQNSGCLCTVDSSTAIRHVIGGPSATHAAILQPGGATPSPDDSCIVASGSPTRIASGYILFSEQPPRHADQNNS